MNERFRYLCFVPRIHHTDRTLRGLSEATPSTQSRGGSVYDEVLGAVLSEMRWYTFLCLIGVDESPN